MIFSSTVSIGKYGAFQANHILGRPYHLTFEILERSESSDAKALRIVSAAELYESILDSEVPACSQGVEIGAVIEDNDGVQYDVVDTNGKVVMRTNRETVDDSNSQKLTTEDIELLKKQETGSGRSLVVKILESHSALDKKTAFALAKYTLRKTKKYMRRFTVLPLDVPLLANWLLEEKEPNKIMEMREETLALIGSWSNVHYKSEDQSGLSQPNSRIRSNGGRWLVVDETGGFLVAAIAERIGILHPTEINRCPDPSTSHDKGPNYSLNDSTVNTDRLPVSKALNSREHTSPMSSKSNTITVIHANSQPNLSLLKYFDFDSTNPSSSHPLYTRLKTLSWLQLLSPKEDTGYAEPEVVSDDVLQSWKGGKRGNYYRKRRRWERVKSVIDETRNGGFDGLVIASVMIPTTILQHTVPLLRGGAQVVVYSPNIEPLVHLADYYSTTRRTAFMSNPLKADELPNSDFPLNPALLLVPTIQTARCRKWQVLPGRTHPSMTSRGGAEGYVFTATRVLPIEGKVKARGNFKRRKVGGDGSAPLVETQDHDSEEVDIPIDASLDEAML